MASRITQTSAPTFGASPVATEALTTLQMQLGAEGFLTNPEQMAHYLADSRGTFRGHARGVARPANTAEVAQTIKLCAGAGLPVVPLGGRTGMVGGGVSSPGAPDGIVLSLERMNRIVAVDEIGATMTVEAGCILELVQREAATHGLLFPLDLGARGSCTIGGNIATNAGGMQVLRYGSMRQLVLGLEVVIASGEIVNGLRKLQKDNARYDLKQVFIGSEGTLGIVTQAVLRLFPRPAALQTMIMAIPDIGNVLTILTQLRALNANRLNAFELIQRFGIELSCKHGSCRDPFDRPYPWYVLVEFEVEAGETNPAWIESWLSEALEGGMIADAVVAQSLTQARGLWDLREVMSDTQHFEGASMKHDISVPIESMPDFITAGTRAVMKALPGARPLVFGHMGDGNVHFNISQPLGMPRKTFLAMSDELTTLLYDLAKSLNGSISAEHGIGQLNLKKLGAYKTAIEFNLMHLLKAAFDPKNILNPGKVINLKEWRCGVLVSPPDH